MKAEKEFARSSALAEKELVAVIQMWTLALRESGVREMVR